MQPETYHIAAEKGIGVLAFSSTAPSELAEYIGKYKEDVKKAQPVGAYVNDQWASFTIGHCGDDNKTSQELGAKAIKSFFGPDRPYISGRADAYEKPLQAWGGVPDHLQADFRRILGGEVDLAGGGDVDQAIWEQMDQRPLASAALSSQGTRIAAWRASGATRSQAPTN